MKMSKKDFDALSAEINAVQDDLGDSFRAAYEIGDFPRADKTKDVSKRHRWDLLFSIRYDWRREFMGRNYDAGLNDDHIDTALRAIVAPIKSTAKEER